MKKSAGLPKGGSPSRLIDARIKELDDWRGATLARLRGLIKAADPDVVEEWKWEVPVWSHDGLICTGETYKSVVKLTFPKGAQLEDPERLFNSSLEGKVRRAIDFHKDDDIDEASFKALIREAVALNRSAAEGSDR
ncbi:MAG TPA: DUF1801 domain-containing protein [Gemmatimonadaceae bacterium]|nr:DUF1801 domain-containing protein [Gemmatimonadaceae bacterium]